MLTGLFTCVEKWETTSSHIRLPIYGLYDELKNASAHITMTHACRENGPAASIEHTMVTWFPADLQSHEHTAYRTQEYSLT